MKMEGAILSTASNNRFRTHLKNAANAFCARTLPKQRRTESVSASTARHHTYPRVTPPKRAPISCRKDTQMCEPHAYDASDTKDVAEVPKSAKGTIKGSFSSISCSRELANAWGCRVGPPDQPAPADRVQNLFNDIELYPTKTQVFEMLVCARQCTRRKSLTLTFGEFCIFATELRRCSRQARQAPNKPESPVWNVEKDLREKDNICRPINGSEASPPPCEVFLGGSCNPTTWRSDIAIPMLKTMGITYFNPQVDDWSMELVEVEHQAKAKARALLFVLDSETRAVAAGVEVAHLAAAPKDLLLVLKPYSRHQTIGNETISDHEYVELSRARATLQETVERRGLPVFTDIPAALRCARAVLRGARTHPRQSLGHTILRLKRVYDAAGGRNGRLSRSKAIDALRDMTNSTQDVDRCLPPSANYVDFELFCAAVAELATDAGHNRSEVEAGADAGAGSGAAAGGGGERKSGGVRVDAQPNGVHFNNARLKEYGRKLGLFIPKNGGTRVTEDGATSGSSGDSVFTPGTEGRLERLPAMLGAPTQDVYLGGTFPANGTRPEEALRREGITYVIPRVNDYTRMFSAPARRSAPAHPESPRRDKKPRPSPPAPDVRLRERSPAADSSARLSASDFYTVTEDVTPQPFKGTYDEDLLLGSRVLVFSMSAEAPCFAAMVLAAHYVGLCPHATVLLVQHMDPTKVTNYSESAVKDYNRGRHYLVDLAQRAGVPVFDNVDDTVVHIASKLRHT
ncbi:uncharacterized protein LOC106138682 isoform X3 [Amyelois transitella]|uniref:uncharacterized protein LOC106138682 isoform X3 n=1 Tax=Amyelois transitella TaxID=680683 RepID=UPI00298F5D0B|nr:uncharacterized protein LOC106138682 isoform X3 [Amyelois transitella]